MGVNSLISLLTPLMNTFSSIFSNASSTSFICSYVNRIANVFESLMTFLSNLFYLIAKWVMLIVDILFSYIQELAGLNMDYSSLDSLLSGDSDIVFRLLYSSKDIVIPIVRSLVVLAIFFIIFFSIVAIIKTYYVSYKSGDPSDVGSVFKRMLKAFVLLILSPMISIVGIIASDLLLQTFYNATNVNASSSLGTHIFAASSTSANAYRIYAQNGMRIPIICNFDEDKKILEYYENNPVNDEFAEYISNSPIYGTYLMFNNGNFVDYDNLNTILYDNTKETNNNYYVIYDRNFSSYSDEANDLNHYKRIDSYAEEYFVMADVIDYAMNTSNVIYFKTIEEIFDSINNLQISDSEKNSLMLSMVGLFEIQFLDENLNEIEIPNLTNDGLYNLYNITENYIKNGGTPWEAISYTSNYYSNDADNEPTIKMPIKYVHLRGATDEKNGAKYVIAVERTLVSDNTTYSYYYPLSNGYSQNTASRFESDYIAKGEIVAAKGIFSDAKYPTAIRQDKSKNQVVFYRENIESVAAGQPSSLFGLSWEQENNNSVFSKIVNFFKTLFDPASLIPKVDIDNEALKQAYSSKIYDINTLENGKLHIGYMMDSSGLGFMNVINQFTTGSIYGLNIANLYKITKINFLILIGGVMILVKVTLNAIFALIERAYELFLIIIFYPTACATLPLTDESYKIWFSKYASKLFATYGLILGINFVFILFPVIESIEFFTPQDVGTSIIVKRIGTLFFLFTNVNGIANLLNMVVAILFELVALTMIQTAPKMVASFLNSASDKTVAVKDVTESESFNNFKKTLSSVSEFMQGPPALIKKSVKKVAKTAHTLAHPVKAAQEFIKKNGYPGSAIINNAKDKKFMHDKKKEQDEAYRDLKEKLARSSTEDGKTDKESKTKEVQESLDKFLKAQDKYTSSLDFDENGNNKARRAAEDLAKKEKKQDLRSSRDDFEDDNGSGQVDDAADEGPDYENMTKHELKKEKKRAKKAIRNVKRAIKESKRNELASAHGLFGKLSVLTKGKSSYLSRRQQESLERNKEILSSSKSEIKKVKGEKKDFKEASSSAKKLNKIAQNRPLTEEEESQLQEANSKMDIYRGRTERSKEAKQQAKQQAKDRAIQKKENEKLARQRHRDYLLFTGGSVEEQWARVNDVSNNMENIKNELESSGITDDISNMSNSDIMNLDGTEEQKALMKRYIEQRETLQQFANWQVAESTARQNELLEKDKRKNSKLVGGHGLNAARNIRRNRLQSKYENVDAQRAELERINNELDEMGNNINADNFDDYQRMNARRAELERKIKAAEDFESKSQDSIGARQDLRQSKRDKKSEDRYTQRAIYNLRRRNSNQFNQELLQKEIERLKALDEKKRKK